MKRNQPVQHPVQKAQVRLIDIGPRIEFFPQRRRSGLTQLQRHLPSAAVSLLTFGLVLYLTIGSGAAVVSSQPEESAGATVGIESAKASAALSGRDLMLFHMIDSGLSPDLLNAESLSRGQSVTAELLGQDAGEITTETLPAETTTTETEPAETTETTQPAETTEPTTVATKVAKTIATTQATTVAITKATTAATTAETTIAETTAAPAPVKSDSGLSADQKQAVIDLSRSLIGIPYVLGGTSSSGLDCSGLTLYIYHKLFDISLEHQASIQAKTGTGVKKSDVRIGDILCFDWDNNGSCDHVGIYIGNNHYVNASRSRGKVCELVADFDSNPIITVRRIIN